MNYQELLQSIEVWGYPLMLILMIIEGPIVTMTASFLASLGLFNWFFVFVLSILGDMLGDILLYAIGYFGGHPIAQKVIKFLKVKASTVNNIENKFLKNGAQIIFYVKTTTGLSWATFILAGTIKMPFKKFLLFSFLGGIIWSGMLVGLGYFFGYAAETIDKYIKFAGWAIFLVALFVILYIVTFRKKRAKKLFWKKFNGS